jgi:hypothetical protein
VGDDDDVGFGFSVFRSEEAFDSAFPLVENEDDEPKTASSLSIYYMPEADVAERWREQRRQAAGYWQVARHSSPRSLPMTATSVRQRTRTS